MDGVLYPSNTGVTNADPITGEWSYTIPAEHTATEDITSSLTVTATDSAGNTSEPADPLVITIDLTPPVFVSGPTADPINENSGSGQVVYAAKASDAHAVQYGLKPDNGDDKDRFGINPTTGDVTLNTNPDYEGRPSYSFTVVAADAAGNSAEQVVTLTISDLPDTAANEVQRIGAGYNSIAYRPGTSVSLPLIYSTSDNDPSLSGLKLNLHYDSDRLTPKGENNGITGQLAANAVTATSAEVDAADSDQDQLTDSIVQLNWASVDNTFPSTELPAEIAIANFQTNSDAYDLVTGAPISTSIDFTAAETASNYGFEGTPVTLVPEDFNLDIDGDGKTTALGDGLMVIRKLFGSAFAGDALTNKAASANATVDTQAMHHWLEAGIASGKLDVDQDGKTTALGDGLIVIRYMFGTAFAGDALIDKAMSNSSPYAGQSNAAELVSQNIEALINPM
jgi:hypothetical protein